MTDVRTLANVIASGATMIDIRCGRCMMVQKKADRR